MSSDVLRRILIRANDDSAGPNTLFLFDEALRDERRATAQMLRDAIDKATQEYEVGIGLRELRELATQMEGARE